MQGLLKGNNGYLSFGALETRCILDEVQFLLKGHQWLIFNHRLKSVFFFAQTALHKNFYFGQKLAILLNSRAEFGKVETWWVCCL